MPRPPSSNGDMGVPPMNHGRNRPCHPMLPRRADFNPRVARTTSGSAAGGQEGFSRSIDQIERHPWPQGQRRSGIQGAHIRVSLFFRGLGEGKWFFLSPLLRLRRPDVVRATRPPGVGPGSVRARPAPPAEITGCVLRFVGARCRVPRPGVARRWSVLPLPSPLPGEMWGFATLNPTHADGQRVG